MPAVFLIAFAIWIAALRIPMKILLLVVFGPQADGWNSPLIDIIPEALILAPLLIAVHRYVILGETARGFPIPPADRYWSFAGCAIAFSFAIQAPNAAVSAMMMEQAVSGTALILLAFLAGAIPPLLLLPTLLVFPAAAIDAPRGKAWRAGISHYWRLLYTMVLAGLPALAITFAMIYVLTVLVRNEILPPLWGSLLAFVIGAVKTMFFGSVFSAAVSRLYRSFTGMDARA